MPVRPGSTRPIAARTSLTPMNWRNYMGIRSIAIWSAIAAGGLMKSRPCMKNTTAKSDL
jgi:hypothetical protein